jgi:iron(III) transport system ATP-binding protein
MEALKTVRLGDYAERRPADLSGGQRQRVALARCLVTSRDVVLLDEPLANLDRHLKKEMEETFREFHQRSGATMIYVTHDQSEAMALATDVAVMSEGRLLQVAEPADIYARPEGRLVGSLIGQGAILSLALAGHAGMRALDWSLVRAALTGASDLAGAGTAAAACHAGVSGAIAGSQVADILVRPEDVVVDDDGVECIVQAVLFEGERYAVRLGLPDGQVLRGYSRRAVAQGERLRVVVRSAWRL